MAISVDQDVRNAQRFVNKAGLQLNVLHDGPKGLARVLDLPALPSTYVLDRDGRVVTVVRGSSEADLAKLERTVESLIAAGPPQDGMVQ